MKFATVRLGKTSVETIRLLAAMPGGIVKEAVTIDVVCTQLPEELIEDTVVFVWLGSDNSKGAPTEWVQGFKAVGVIEGITRGAKYNDESTTTVSLKYMFANAITRLDVLRDCPEAYYWCSSLPIIGLDDHSNQTIRCFADNLERGEIGAFLYSLNSVSKSFRHDIVSIMPEIDNLFWATVKSPKTGDVLGASSAPETNMHHRLDEALKVFAEKKATEQVGGGKTYDECYAEVRAEAAKIDGDYLVSCDYEAFRNTLNARQVANSFFSRHTDDDKRRLGDFIAAVRQAPRDISFYLAPGNQPNVPGIGPAMLTAFLTRTRPDLFAFFTEQMFESVKFLGLTAEEALPALSTDAYNTYRGIQTAIRDRMREMGIKAENGNFADYLTVNEFTWFVSENKDLIKEKVMSKKMKTDVPTKYDESKRKPLSFNHESKDDELLFRLLSALRAKPFAILAGHSGTGKSRYVKKLAYMTCNAEELRVEGQLPGNYLLLQVKPNWHDSTDLLGFRNAMDGNRYQKTALIEFLFRAYHFKDTPFFLCLDEMNLAPVEQYFAEFLSAMESTEPVPLNDITADEDNLYELGCEWTDALDYLKTKKFSIPKNLFIVGTVNMDETTNQFSRKVLDRAFTIEMTDVDFANFGKVTEPSYEDTIEEANIEALLNGEQIVTKLDAEDTAEGAALVKVQKALEPTAFAIAYRFANEYTLLKRAFAVFDPDGTMKLDALDQAVLMKILPRIAGEKDYIKGVYGKPDKSDNSDSKGLWKALEGKQASRDKIKAILDRAEAMNASYVTFWP